MRQLSRKNRIEGAKKENKSSDLLLLMLMYRKSGCEKLRKKQKRPKICLEPTIKDVDVCLTRLPVDVHGHKNINISLLSEKERKAEPFLSSCPYICTSIEAQTFI